MQYAATHGVCAPKVLSFYKIRTTKPTRSIAIMIVMERVPGVPLADVWLDLSAAEQSSIKTQLRTQIKAVRRCTQPYTGCIDNQSYENIYSRYVARGEWRCGPFPDDKAFDEWCMARLRVNPLMRFQWKRRIEGERRQSSGRFVLTHGDLAARNIMVDKGVITGIVDWGRSGFYPEYAEYAIAMELCHCHEDWWYAVLKEVLQPCSKERLRFTHLVESSGFKFPGEEW